MHDPATLIVAFDRITGNRGANTPGVLTQQGWEAGAVAYNFSHEDYRAAPGQEAANDTFSRSLVDTDWQTSRREGPA